ncbi:hypothetical protein V1282_004560 [Nitrobacteraceae bacterium AZCC 2146]
MRASPFNLLLKLSFAHAVAVGLAGCATAPLETSGSLASYNGLEPAAGITTQSKLRVDKADILAARSVSIVPTSFSNATSRTELTDKQRRVIANAVDRSVCIGLSDRFYVVPPGQAADLTVHVTVTHVTVTNASVAAASKVASAAPMFISSGAPIMIPRIPYGMGSLSVEAEARDIRGQQKAAFVWARGADMLTSTPRVSASGDAYDLASEFGADFSKLLITGENPFDKKLSMPTMQRVQSSFGGKPKYAACDAFGRTGVPAFIGGKMGAPPEWNDDAMPVTE